MASAKIHLAKLSVVLAMAILFLVVQPSRFSSPECQWLQKKGEHIDNKILIPHEQCQPKVENRDHCFDIPDNGFPNNIHELKAAVMVVHTVYNETMIFYSNYGKTLGLLENDYDYLRSLLEDVINELAQCVTNAGQYKDFTDPISNQYRELEKHVQKWGNSACAQNIFWVISENLEKAVPLSSQMRKMNLMNKTS
ncbi:hypothetical protein XELAEV_18019062mg [Xenopus laevis]|nr:uncharacterized LOC121401184 precursor [Xenopus laevis]ANQ43332.1 type I interferon 20 [Xenopus laevis]OCT90448.1 hypothetical protein XELAEV_18019062mg [Xenopus laevis]